MVLPRRRTEPKFSRMRVDLHLHSTASDGSLSPSALVWAARAGGLDVVAITDHDTCAGVDEATATVPAGLKVIPGIELSTTIDGAELHILGYYIDPENEKLRAHAEHAISARRERVRRIIELLHKYNINIAMEDVLAAAEGSNKILGRPHVAKAMQHKGYVQTPAEAFDRFLGDAGPCFLPTELLHPREAVAMIHGAGGVSVWAHPRPDVLEVRLPELVGWGLRGVECYRPRSSASEMDAIKLNATRHGLLVSGGSDWHGSWHGRLGDFHVAGTDVSAFLAVGGM